MRKLVLALVVTLPAGLLGVPSVHATPSRAHPGGASSRMSCAATSGSFAWCPTWVSRWPTGAETRWQVPVGMAVSPATDNIYVFGQDYDPTSGRSAYATAAFGPDGTRLWAARYAQQLYAVPAGVAVSPDGSAVFVTGFTDSTDISDSYLTTIAYDGATGRQLWISRFQNAPGTLNAGYRIAVVPDGSLVVVTGQWQHSSNFDALTVAYDAATGQRTWVATYANPSFDRTDEGFGLGLSPDGIVAYVTGESQGRTTGFDVLTIAYYTSGPGAGEQQWVSRVDAGPDDEGLAVAVSADGSRVFVTGKQEDPSAPCHTYCPAYRILTIGYLASTGQTLWRSRYMGPSGGRNIGVAATASPAGDAVYVTGFASGRLADSDFDIPVLAMDQASGKLLWVRTTAADVGYDLEEGFSIAPSPDGTRVYVTGSSQRSTSASGDQLTMVFDPSGTLVALSRYNDTGTDNDSGAGVQTSSDGRTVYTAEQLVHDPGLPDTDSDFGVSAYPAP